MPRIRTKLLIAFLVIVLVPLIGTGLYGNWATSKIITENALESARNDVQLHAEQMVDSLQRVHGDVLYLAHLDNLNHLVEAQIIGDESTITAKYTQVMRDFLIFSAARPAYYQIRYLDEDGQEVVRIDSDGRSSRVVREADLQNKAHRYYFQEAMQLPSGGIFVSPLDLNRENNQIERPLTPVIRYATPLFDDQDNRRGIVIINIYASHFMASLEEDSSTDSQLIMVNQDGYYLIHPDMSRLWGGPADLNSGKNIRQDYPEQAEMLLKGELGDFIAHDRAVVYTTLFPVAADRSQYWVIMRDNSATMLFAPVQSFRLTAVSILAAAILVAMGMALFLSRQLANPILTLRQGVERFGQGKLDQPIPVQSQDEIGQLTHAFNDMASTINRHLDQLTTLTKAGQKISSSLERQVTLDAILQAALELFSANYCAILIKQTDNSLHPLTEAGDTAWTLQRETKGVQAAQQHILSKGVWKSAWLDDLSGYYCSAYLCWEPGQEGMIELYGRNPTLLEPTTGNLLSTLAVEASVALKNIDLYEKLADHKQQLEALVEQLINAQEVEREVVAYDIHDGLIQYLVAARLHLS
ncbi:MAG: HAMP domain-containing protein, partial [Chloroflexi bacterium]|nr:HAMP domain-containing protein [Chloroflexota bacterium]